MKFFPKLGERGSVVVFVVFGLAIFFAGGLYSVIDYYVDAIDETVSSDLGNDEGYKFQLWFWNFGILVLMLIGIFSWFLATLQKARYREG